MTANFVNGKISILFSVILIPRFSLHMKVFKSVKFYQCSLHTLLLSKGDPNLVFFICMYATSSETHLKVHILCILHLYDYKNQWIYANYSKTTAVISCSVDCSYKPRLQMNLLFQLPTEHQSAVSPLLVWHRRASYYCCMQKHLC